MLLVDVYNVLHTTGVLPPDLAGIEVSELAQLVLASRYGSLEVILVCDGTGGGAANRGVDPYRNTGGAGVRRRAGSSRARRRGTVSVVYAGKGMDADTVIEVMIRGGGRHGHVGSGAYGKAIVVSSDRAVRASARRARARSILSEDFLQHLADDWKYPRGPHVARHQPRPGADDRPGFARKTPLDRYSVEEWLHEFGFGSSGPTQAEWDALLAELHSPHRHDDQSSSDRPADAAPRGSRTPGDDAGVEPPAAGHGPRHEPPDRPPPSSVDPLTRAAMQEWPGRVNPEDLDMQKWLDADERLRGE
ncbi:MAG: hypothetical protein AB7G11_03490 [Phycisphaerales bacterium]